MASPYVAPRATIIGGTSPVDHVSMEWKVGMLVTVKPRTWAGINRLGGHGRVTSVHLDETSGHVSKIDVAYVLGGTDKLVDLHYVEPYLEDLDAGIGAGKKQRRATKKEKEGPNASRKTKLTFGEAPSTKKKLNNDENARNSASVPAAEKQLKKGLKRSDRARTLLGELDHLKTARPPVKRKLGAGDVADAPVPVTTPDVPQVIFLDTSFPSPSPMASSSPLAKGNNSQAYMLPESSRRRLQRIKEQPVASSTPRKMSPLQKQKQKSPDSPSGLSMTSPFKYRAATIPGERGAPLPAKQGPKPITLQQQASPGGACPPNRPVDYRPIAATSSPDPKEATTQFPASKSSPPRATLQSEHERVINDAAKFIKEVVVSDKKSPTKKEQVEPPSPAAPSKIDFNLLAKFSRAFQELWENCDGGGVEEEGLANQINQYCSDGNHFEDQQIQELLDHLCQQNKVMRSDGQLYVI